MFDIVFMKKYCTKVLFFISNAKTVLLYSGYLKNMLYFCSELEMCFDLIKIIMFLKQKNRI
jgi:hypothetical protein